MKDETHAPGWEAGSVTGAPLLYGELAEWWPLLSAPADYAEEAAFYTETLKDACARRSPTLLELGSGGGNNASHMKTHFGRVTLVDRAPEMLEVSRRLNGECVHAQGDMRSIRLDELFDCVFVHDAICYATTLDDLRAVFDTAYTHCRPGGAALFAPDYLRETFSPTTGHGGHDADDGRGLRYLEWAWDPDPGDTTYLVEYALLLRAKDGRVEVRYDRHVEGLFTKSDWLSSLEHAGFAPRAVRSEHSEQASEAWVFLGAKM